MRNVLIVDAGESVVDTAGEVLQGVEPGTGVCTAHHTDACRHALEPWKFDLVIIDHKPNISGEYDVLDGIRGQCAELPVIMSFSPDNEPLALEALRRGANDYVVKTHYFAAALTMAVRRAFEMNALRRSLAECRLECDELKRSRQLKRDFLAKAGHALRTPLSSMRIYAQYLASGRLGPLSQQQCDKVELILKGMERLTHCIEDVQRYERLEAGKIDLVQTRFDLRDALSEAIGTVTRTCMEKGVTLSQSWPSEPIIVCADRELLFEALKDLLDNAVAFTPPKGSISVAVVHRDAGVYVSITDSGCGISQEKLAHLFEPLMAAEHLAHNYGCGPALGLSMVKRILDLHGSSLDVDSKPETGTRMRFVLPRVNDCGAPANVATTQTRVDLRKRMVLVVDDDEDNLGCTRAVLEFAGYDVVCANGFSEAKAQLADGRIDAVLMDVEMRGTSGLDTLKILKHSPATSNLPVIMLSAHVEDTVRAEAARLGASGYVVKPFSATKLLRELTNVLSTATPSFA
jgi:signal transduction histidine kinase/ActR/RegA family two-component response regulator